MKSIMAIVVALILAFAPVALAAEAGNGYWQPVTLLSAATGTTSAYSTDTYTFRHPVTSISCDTYSSPTASFSFQLVTNSGYISTFATTTAAGAPMAAASYTAQQNRKTITGDLFRSVKAIVTMGSQPAAVVSIYCIGSH